MNNNASCASSPSTRNRRRLLQALAAAPFATSPLFAAQNPTDSCIPSRPGALCNNAHRIATLDGRYAEYLLLLKLQPVATTSLRAQQHFYKDLGLTLDGSVQNLGLPTSPDLEKLLFLKPDLIVTNGRTVQKNLALLRRMAPVLFFDIQPRQGTTYYDWLWETMDTLAASCGRANMAAALHQSFEQGLAQDRARLEASGWKDRPILVGTINAGITGADVMLFNGNSLPAQILKRLGLRYAYNDPRHDAKGFRVTTVETLALHQDAFFLYMPYNAVGVDHLLTTPVWGELDFARRGDFAPIPYRPMFASPASAQALTNDMVGTLLKHSAPAPQEPAA